MGAQIRSRVQWVEQGEKNTKYFLGLEKNRQTRKTINSRFLYIKVSIPSF
jgi:hypothetical protein